MSIKVALVNVKDEVKINMIIYICIFIYIYLYTIWTESLVGAKFGEMTRFEQIAKESLAN